ncbi:4Fe-4S dicluster domain-containing protein [Desulfofalx alkaliphila]|uniref:4Fe-4S dicluster domain-containing protein n=1 Tax=Desulfofalx alkaliphila TaxID=105483 RepID=UPI000AAB62D9|nr:4Fe-4S dicluster domain-containing protein [Desulfofalx alkaliphila]
MLMAEAGATRKYDPEFTKEVYKMENGHWVKMCMQCGICPTTCTLRGQMDLSPRRIIQLIRSGAKDEVLKSNTMWLCTSCYTCACRCPRGVPMMDVMHDLRRLAEEAGYVNNSSHMSKVYYGDVAKRGRVWEGGLTIKYGLKLGIFNAMKLGLEMQDVVMQMMKHKRLPIFPPPSVKNPANLRKMLDKAAALAKEEG